MEVSSAHICRPDLDAKAFIPDFTVKEKFESNSGAGNWCENPWKSPWKAHKTSSDVKGSP